MVPIVQVAVDQTAYHFDKPFDYIVPENLKDRVRPGCRVLVPFGRGDRRRQGIVLSCSEGEGASLKRVADLPDEEPLLSPEMLQLALWMKETTFCTVYEAVRLMLPAGIHLKMKDCYAAADFSEEMLNGFSAEERQIALFLKKNAGLLPEDKIAARLKLQSDSCGKMLLHLSRSGILIRSQTAVQQIGDASLRMVRLTEQPLPEKLTARQRAVVELLQEVGSAAYKEVCYFCGVTASVLQALERKSVIECYEAAVSRSRYAAEPETRCDPSAVKLTPEQENAFEAFLQKQQKGGGISLLYGVTGSGKTSVFLRLIDETVRRGDNVILMVPEISLTPQLITLFRRCFGSQIAVFHSALSLGERKDEWMRVFRGEAKIAIGTRSAVFAPFRSVGLIVMDEEQEQSYKSESSPRFHAREIARFRCQYHHALLLLASATPSVESFYYAQNGRYGCHVLKKRYGNAQLPQVEVVDMTENTGRSGIFSTRLIEELEHNLREKRQSILLLNRRGYHTFVSCSACQKVLACPNCSISMTYHTANHRLMCHYCGHSVPLPEKCPNCGEPAIRYGGTGTQRAEEELKELFPQARVLRMDADTTMARFSHEEKLAQFSAGKFDILIGTQMVAKGLDFPNVTLVGVLSADQELYGDDFRSYERAFSLLTQVVGRAGRGAAEGKALIQTMTPHNPIIRMAAQQDYDAFYRGEIEVRRAMLYPPFADLCVVGFVGSAELPVKNAADAFLSEFKALAAAEYPELPLRVVGPSPAAVLRVNQKYRYKLLIKCRSSSRFRRLLSQLLVQHGQNRNFNGVTVYADMNPDNIL
ncbi:MAG: primosomal protein N' [Firmicutes bacterium]|nr:primosomal protein N' [Bacillota bacterium]